MASEPNHYQVLGIEPTADQAAVEAAYQSRSMRFRLGKLRDRPLPTAAGPGREEVEQAYAVLGNPQARAEYDAVHFPGKVAARRRMPFWVWLVAAGWIALIAVVVVVGARSLLAGDGGRIGEIVATATITPPATVVAALPPSPTATAATVAPTATSPAVTSTPVPTVAPTSPPTATAPAAPTPTATPETPSLTFRPTATESAPAPTPTTAPTAPPATTAPPTVPPPTATAVPATEPPTATLAPTPTPVATEPPPPPPTEPPPTEPPPPAPTPTPSFRATDRVGVQVQVNLRAGPGTNYGSLGTLAPGTLLAATGQAQNAGGFLWRQFRLADGRVGWVRDIDVLAVR